MKRNSDRRRMSFIVALSIFLMNSMWVMAADGDGQSLGVSAAAPRVRNAVTDPVPEAVDSESERVYDRDLGDDSDQAPVLGISGVVALSAPKSFAFTLDPFEVAGRGQIYSEPLIFENRGDFPVRIGISSISYQFANTGDFIAHSEPFAYDEIQAGKDIYAGLRSLDGALDIPLFGEKPDDGNQMSFILTPGGRADAHGLSGDQDKGSVAEFAFYGSLNPMPEIPWRPGDVTVEIIYECTPIVADGEGEGDDPAPVLFIDGGEAPGGGEANPAVKPATGPLVNNDGTAYNEIADVSDGNAGGSSGNTAAAEGQAGSGTSAKRRKPTVIN